MTKQDREQFKAYLRNCTDVQVQGVYDKERRLGGHSAYVRLALAEAARRGLEIVR